MELWIRSQDKEDLLKVSGVRINCFNEKEIKAYFNDDDTIIATYATKKRALEVLDEIQNILMPKTIIKSDAIVNEEDLQRFKKAFNENEAIILNKATIEHLDTYVYEMPKE